MERLSGIASRCNANAKGSLHTTPSLAPNRNDDSVDADDVEGINTREKEKENSIKKNSFFQSEHVECSIGNIPATKFPLSQNVSIPKSNAIEETVEAIGIKSDSLQRDPLEVKASLNRKTKKRKLCLSSSSHQRTMESLSPSSSSSSTFRLKRRRTTLAPISPISTTPCFERSQEEVMDGDVARGGGEVEKLFVGDSLALFRRTPGTKAELVLLSSEEEGEGRGRNEEEVKENQEEAQEEEGGRGQCESVKRAAGVGEDKRRERIISESLERDSKFRRFGERSEDEKKEKEREGEGQEDEDEEEEEEEEEGKKSSEEEKLIIKADGKRKRDSREPVRLKRAAGRKILDGLEDDDLSDFIVSNGCQEEEEKEEEEEERIKKDGTDEKVGLLMSQRKVKSGKRNIIKNIITLKKVGRREKGKRELLDDDLSDFIVSDGLDDVVGLGADDDDDIFSAQYTDSDEERKDSEFDMILTKRDPEKYANKEEEEERKKKKKKKKRAKEEKRDDTSLLLSSDDEEDDGSDSDFCIGKGGLFGLEKSKYRISSQDAIILDDEDDAPEPYPLAKGADGEATYSIPPYMNKILFGYQRLGVQFLFDNFIKGVGAILGDDMVCTRGTSLIHSFVSILYSPLSTFQFKIF